MSRPKLRAPQAGVRPPFRPRARIVRRYEASVTAGYAVETHADDCPCHVCDPAPPAAAAAPRPIDPPLPIVRLTFAAIVTANAIANTTAHATAANHAHTTANATGNATADDSYDSHDESLNSDIWAKAKASNQWQKDGVDQIKELNAWRGTGEGN